MPGLAAAVQAKREAKREAEERKLKSEVKAEVKAEVKREAVKVEVKREAVKAEVKREPIKSEHGVKAEVKRESVKAEPAAHVADLLARGLALRQAAQQVKQEQGLKGKLKKKIKLEQGKRKRGTRRKGRATAKKRNASREVMNREVPLSPQLAELLGAPALSRPEAVKRLWGHCREQGMLNPADKREILFNESLRGMFGRDKARMYDLMGMLMPHFDYAAQAAAAATGVGIKAQQKQEPCPVKQLIKGEGVAVKRTLKGEVVAVKRPLKGEVPAVKRQVKGEQTAVKRPVKEESVGAMRPCKGEPRLAKREPGTGADLELVSVGAVDVDLEDERPLLRGAAAVKAEASLLVGGGQPAVDLREVAASLAPELSRIGRTAVSIECRLDERAVAAASFAVRAAARCGGAGGHEEVSIVELGSVDFRETAEGKFVPYMQASLSGLDPVLAYRISVEVSPSGMPAGGVAAAASAEVVLPQRSVPGRWTASEALQWCSSLGIPSLTDKAREYRFTGTTLFGLREQDLRSMGLSEPSVIRRFISGIRDLKAGGA